MAPTFSRAAPVYAALCAHDGAARVDKRLSELALPALRRAVCVHHAPAPLPRVLTAGLRRLLRPHTAIVGLTKARAPATAAIGPYAGVII